MKHLLCENPALRQPGAFRSFEERLSAKLSKACFAVTVTYLNPVAGITAPTALQASNSNRVSADIIASADGDVAATVTHNFALSVAQVANGAGNVIATQILTQALAALSAWTWAAPTTNAVVGTKLATVGSGNAAAQQRVTVLRHSYLD